MYFAVFRRTSWMWPVLPIYHTLWNAEYKVNFPTIYIFEVCTIFTIPVRDALGKVHRIKNLGQSEHYYCYETQAALVQPKTPKFDPPNDLEVVRKNWAARCPSDFPSESNEPTFKENGWELSSQSGISRKLTKKNPQKTGRALSSAKSCKGVFTVISDNFEPIFESRIPSDSTWLDSSQRPQVDLGAGFPSRFSYSVLYAMSKHSPSTP
jgi:hypothetical protein